MSKRINIEILELKDKILAAKEVEKISEEKAQSTIIWLIDIFGGEIAPVVGDIFTSWYFYYQANKLAKKIDLPAELQRKILNYYILDTICGLVPGIGFIGDILYRANSRTAKIFKEYREKLEEELINLRRK